MRRRFIGAMLFLLALAAAPAAMAQGQDPDDAVGEEDADLLPYRGTTIIYENSMAAYTLDPAHDQTYNPTYAMSWVFRPRWYIYENLSARLDFGIDLELTDSDWTASNYEPIVSDLSLGFVWSDFYTIPVAEIRLGAGLWMNFPTSKVSQARTLYMGLAPTFSVRRIFDVLGGMYLTYSFRYTKNFNEYSTMMADIEAYPCPLSAQDRTACYNMGVRNPSMSFSNTFTIEQYFLDRLYAALSVGVVNTLLYPVGDATVETPAGPVDVLEAEDNTDHRAYMSYAFEVGYDATDYLSVAIGWSTLNPQLDDEGNWRAPFINRYTNVYLDVALSIDGLVTELTGSNEDDADVASSADVSAVAARW